LFSGFSEAFSEADRVVVLDVFSAREEKPEDFSIADLVKEINHSDVLYIPERKKAFDLLQKELCAGDLLLIFTAGDAIEINVQLEQVFSDQGNI
jgi:UDP-N-acetylmuramate-alanine ligase